jgi:hypothetical protein
MKLPFPIIVAAVLIGCARAPSGTSGAGSGGSGTGGSGSGGSGDGVTLLTPCDPTLDDTRCSENSAIARCTLVEGAYTWVFDQSCVPKRCAEFRIDGRWLAGCGCDGEEGPGLAGDPCTDANGLILCAPWLCLCADDPTELIGVTGCETIETCADGVSMCLDTCLDKGGLIGCKHE